MLLSLKWLADYVGKPLTQKNPLELAEELSMRGIAVDSVRQAGSGFANVLVGRIEEIEKHPNADRLQVTKTRVSENQVLQIVCGAKNITVGDTVPVAMIGAILPGGIEIKQSTIRGTESFGMLCSGKELNVDQNSEGILQLPKHAQIGQPLSDLLGGGKTDTVMELELTANRGDCLSVIGIAREVCAILETPLKEPKPSKFQVTQHRTSNILKIQIDDIEKCPRYVAHVIDSLKITESPDWIKERLEAVGSKPINNVVDITNFVMLEYGQPLHAFDLRKLKSGEIRVATCQEPMDFQLLTGATVKLEPGDILIQDGHKPIALAGIMGGLDSQVTKETTSILLESAVFDAVQIRKTAKRLGLQTDASKRFERKVDFLGAITAAERAAALLRDGYSANVYFPPIDTFDQEYVEKTIALDLREIRKLLGLPNITPDEISTALATIGFTCSRKSANVINAVIPSYRNDVNESVDVIEEIARIVGYDAIPCIAPKSVGSIDKFDDDDFDFQINVRRYLRALGLRETVHFSFCAKSQLEKYGAPTENAIQLLNPITEDHAIMRTSLLPALLDTYAYNVNRKISNQRIFEMAPIYFKEESTETKTAESMTLSGLLAGSAVANQWTGDSRPVDYFFVKGLVEILLKRLDVEDPTFSPYGNSTVFHPGRSANIFVGETLIGHFGMIHPSVQKNILDSHEAIAVFELNVNAIRRLQKRTQVKMPSKFPSVDMDLALVINKTIASSKVLERIAEIAGPLLAHKSVFDVYTGSNVPNGHQSLGIRLGFVSYDRTLTEAEVQPLREKIIQTLSQEFNAQLR